MVHEEWARDLAGEVLANRYDVTALSIDPVPQGTSTINWRAVTEDGQGLYLKQYGFLNAEDMRRARAAWDMSEYCRAAELPVPQAWTDCEGNLLTVMEGTVWAVAEEAPGRVATDPMTVARAEHIGLVMGRMHRVLAAYPLPSAHRPTRWLTHTVEQSVARCNTTLKQALQHRTPRLPQVRADLEQRREDLRRHTRWLRAQLPTQLVEQALHADFSRVNTLVLTDVVSAVIDFRAETATPAWELGQAAFDPRSVAHGGHWMQCAVRMIAAYRSENPSLPQADVQACARIALLYMLHSFYGATTAEYRLPAEEEADVQQHWADRQIAIRRLIEHLDDIETALASIAKGR